MALQRTNCFGFYRRNCLACRLLSCMWRSGALVNSVIDSLRLRVVQAVTLGTYVVVYVVVSVVVSDVVSVVVSVV